MNILLINHYAGSPRHGMEYRPYYLAREWVRMGHAVHIVASTVAHVRTMPPQAGLAEETIDGIRYHWVRTPNYKGNGLGRVRNMAAFVLALFCMARFLARSVRPDLVIASSTYPMDIWPARFIASLSGSQLVFEVHDLWPLSPMELGGMSRWHPFILLIQSAEDYAYRHAHHVISMLPKVQDYMVSRGLDPAKLRIVPNGVDPEEWENTNEALDPELIKQLEALKAQGLRLVGYAGAHGVANALDNLLAAAESMLADKVCFILFGNGSEKDRLQEKARAIGLRNVIFFDPVQKHQIPALLKWFDVAYIGWSRQPLYRFGIAPNKLMDYMMAGRVVLHAVDAGNDPVGEARCGLTVEPDNPAAAVAGIRELLSSSEFEREQMGQRGREFVLKRHTYPVLAKSFLAICE